MDQSIFSTMRPGSIVEYRTEIKTGLRFGRFRKYEAVYHLVTIETIPAYKAQPEIITVHEDLVDRWSAKPKSLVSFKRTIAAFDEKAQAEAAAALALMEQKKKEQREADAKKTAVVADVKVEVANWRKAAAAKAWETMRAKKAAAAVVGVA